jgi:tRNA-specific 2-thiouridylase
MTSSNDDTWNPNVFFTVMKIAVGMSGGVDSSVSALLLKKGGHDVIGVIMRIWDGRYSMPARKNACFGPDEAEDVASAQQVCDHLGIPLHVINCAQQYEEFVLQYFRSEYIAGRTPNPCVRCNHMIKFGLLPKLLREKGERFDLFATGHYARIEFNQSSRRYLLKKGVDPAKDQSYFLYRLSQEQLSGIIFPLGEYHKESVKQIARDAGLSVSDKKESQDFCSGDYGAILNAENREGPIIDSHGKMLGTHQGIWNFTVGQRKGIGVAFSEALYVIKIDPEHNAVVVGTRDEVRRSRCMVSQINWIAAEKPESRMDAMVKVRSTDQGNPATIELTGPDSATVSFVEPHAAIPPGQSAVFYDGNVMIGGGIIASVE